MDPGDKHRDDNGGVTHHLRLKSRPILVQAGSKSPAVRRARCLHPVPDLPATPARA